MESGSRTSHSPNRSRTPDETEVLAVSMALPYYCRFPDIKIACQRIRGHSVRVLLDREPDLSLRAGAYWSVYEYIDRAPGSRRSAGRGSSRTECPNLSAHYLYL